MKSLKLKYKLKGMLQRFAFHKRLPSLCLAALMLLRPSKKALRSLSDFHRLDSCPDRKALRKRLFDMSYSKWFYALIYDDYFLFGIDESKDPSKLDYVCWHELKHYYGKMDRMGRPEIFMKKELTYEAFREYFHRELQFISSPEQKDAFLSFFSRHGAGMLKPPDSFGGKGIEILRTAEGADPEQLWERVKDRVPFVLEELIDQAPEMAAFHPQSVNTIRYTTFYHNGELTRLQAVLRVGCGGMEVDNASSGGLFALVDTETGRILGPGRDDYMALFETHPDTGVRFEGNSIAHWDELKALIEELVRVVPEQMQVGWDLALSRDGWVVVEGNTKPGLQSFDFYHGMRPLIRRTFGSVVKMWA